jgi:4-diphosphocytidyl-2C-methyl-D-erythritol kinase
MDALHLLPMLVNDLEQPAFDLSNDLSQLRDRAEQVLQRPVRMSGSGSTLFTIFDTSAESLEFARVVTGQLRVRAVSVDLAPDLSSE